LYQRPDGPGHINEHGTARPVVVVAWFRPIRAVTLPSLAPVVSGPPTRDPVTRRAGHGRSGELMIFAVRAAAAAGVVLPRVGAAASGAVVSGAGAPGRALGIAALVTWLLDAGSGAYMLGTWIVRGGLRRQAATGDRLAPAVVFSHFGLATTGLLMWVSYLASRLPVLGWLAIGLLTLVIGLGISTVTLWTPFPAHRAAGDAGPAADRPAGGGPAEDAITLAVTDAELARALTDEALLARLVDDVLTRAPADRAQDARKPRWLLTTLIPAGHGVAAMATVLLAVLAAVSAR
jgi:manganese efflux pump family protein